jgi:hypothetical protein
VLFNVQWDDERFDRDGQLTLFDLLGAEDAQRPRQPSGAPHAQVESRGHDEPNASQQDTAAGMSQE